MFTCFELVSNQFGGKKIPWCKVHWTGRTRRVSYATWASKCTANDPLKPTEKTTKKMNLISPLHWSAVRTAFKHYLNLYENHFSYIKDLARYSRSFCCCRCGKYWKKASRLSRYENTCDGKVQFKYPVARNRTKNRFLRTSKRRYYRSWRSPLFSVPCDIWFQILLWKGESTIIKTHR